MVNDRDVLAGCLVKIEIGALRGRRVMKVRMGGESGIVLASGKCGRYGVFYMYVY